MARGTNTGDSDQRTIRDNGDGPTKNTLRTEVMANLRRRYKGETGKFTEEVASMMQRHKHGRAPTCNAQVVAAPPRTRYCPSSAPPCPPRTPGKTPAPPAPGSGCRCAAHTAHRSCFPCTIQLGTPCKILPKLLQKATHKFQVDKAYKHSVLPSHCRNQAYIPHTQ